MTNINYNMSFKSENGNSVTVIFHTNRVIELLISNIQFFYDDMKVDKADYSYSIPLILNTPTMEFKFSYPKNRSSSYHSVGFNIHDCSQNLDLQVIIKYDENALPDIRVIKKEV